MSVNLWINIKEKTWDILKFSSGLELPESVWNSSNLIWSKTSVFFKFCFLSWYFIFDFELENIMWEDFFLISLFLLNSLKIFESINLLFDTSLTLIFCHNCLEVYDRFLNVVFVFNINLITFSFSFHFDKNNLILRLLL